MGSRSATLLVYCRSCDSICPDLVGSADNKAIPGLFDPVRPFPREAMANPEPSDGSPQPAPESTPAVRANLQTSLSLLHRVRARDQEAWRRLFYLYRPLVLYWCSRWGVLHENADDVSQEVF